ncbi:MULTISPECIES: hypothetical protein [unclassified Flavobacterium]|uniref:hypothetical protein n=1 Tax=unclassified Flavobacterium TaxID=196869 RepID=UPI0025C0C79E|nr:MULTISPECIES: hypothetical protein [unclassified Flavobacterium]
MKNYIKIVFLFYSFFSYSQNTKIIILDAVHKKPLAGVQLLSENGSSIGNTNSKGEFEVESGFFQKSGIKSIMIYDSDYLPIEYKIDEIPNTVYLEKSENYELKPVIIIKKLSGKYFTIKGYVRSWKLVNNKLVKYGDGLIEYHIPYDTLKYNDFVTGIKNFATEYRTFKTDSIKPKSRIISISRFESYLNYRIPKRDLLTIGWKRYKLESVKDNLYSVFKKDKNVGFAIKDKNNNSTEININESFEGEETIKFLFWKFSGSYNVIEKWIDNGDIRHLSYSFSSEKTLIKTKIKGKFNAVETINEIFIDDKIIYNDKIPEKSKPYIDKDLSFYNTEYWKEQIKKHPLPSAINNQLINVNENKNNY